MILNENLLTGADQNLGTPFMATNIETATDNKLSAQSINNTPIDQALSDFQVPLDEFLKDVKDSSTEDSQIFNDGPMSTIADSAFF